MVWRRLGKSQTYKSGEWLIVGREGKWTLYFHARRINVFKSRSAAQSLAETHLVAA